MFSARRIAAFPMFSELTMALLQDSGWYLPDYTLAGPFHFGRTAEGANRAPGTLSILSPEVCFPSPELSIPRT